LDRAVHYTTLTSGLGAEIFYLVVATALLLGTFIILLSCLISIATASILPKTTYEYLYHFIAFLLYLAASLVLLIETLRTDDRYRYREYGYDLKIAASVLGLVLSILYLVSSVFAYRSYRTG
jgi:sugar phosphate permease